MKVTTILDINWRLSVVSVVRSSDLVETLLLKSVIVQNTHHHYSFIQYCIAYFLVAFK